jgi:hypothetical protein
MRLRTSNACENVNGQIKERTRVVGLFPSEDSLLRLITGVLIEIAETWETGKTYLSQLTKNPKNTNPTTFRKSHQPLLQKKVCSAKTRFGSQVSCTANATC